MNDQASVKHGDAVDAPRDPGAPAREGGGPRRRNARAGSPVEATSVEERELGAGRRLWSVTKLCSAVLVVLGISAGMAWGAYRYAHTSPRFLLTKLELSGNRRATTEHIKELAGIKDRQNILALDLDRAQESILADPWIRRVKITRELPGTLRVELEERSAQAVAALDDDLYLVTEGGEPFKQLGPGDPYDLPVITGIRAADLAENRQSATERLREGLRIIRLYERTEIGRVHLVQEVNLTPEGRAVLTVGKSGTVLHLGPGSWAKKVLMAERVLSQLARKGQTPGIVFLDNEAHPERVVVRMR